MHNKVPLCRTEHVWCSRHRGKGYHRLDRHKKHLRISEGGRRINKSQNEERCQRSLVMQDGRRSFNVVRLPPPRHEKGSDYGKNHDYRPYCRKRKPVEFEKVRCHDAQTINPTSVLIAVSFDRKAPYLSWYTARTCDLGELATVQDMGTQYASQWNLSVINERRLT